MSGWGFFVCHEIYSKICVFQRTLLPFFVGSLDVVTQIFPFASFSSIRVFLSNELFSFGQGESRRHLCTATMRRCTRTPSNGPQMPPSSSTNVSSPAAHYFYIQTIFCFPSLSLHTFFWRAVGIVTSLLAGMGRVWGAGQGWVSSA